MKFDINNYPGKYVMRCRTEEEARDFCNYLHSIGRKWSTGESYLERTHYYTYGCNTAYNFNQGSYCDVNYFQYYTVLEWSDFMSKKFTKANLKTGDIIQRRNGQTEIINGELKMCIIQHGWNDLDDVRLDLTSKLNKEWDVVAVRRPKEKFDCRFDAFERERGTLVYERKEVEEMTLEQVCKLLGKEIKIIK